jgi:HEAT repeat protein
VSVIDKLACSLGRRDEVPNQELAKALAKKPDAKAVKELAENLHSRNKGIRQNCIKVLYELGEADPGQIAPFYKEFVALLDDKNNRMQWGAMTALSNLAHQKPKELLTSIGKIIGVANKGGVITRDHCVKILMAIGSDKKYTDKIFPLLREQLLLCPTNQLPSYAEQALPLINEKNKALFIKTLSSRLDEIEKESKRKRVEKVISKLNKKA